VRAVGDAPPRGVQRVGLDAQVARHWWYAPILLVGAGVALRGPIVCVLAILGVLALLAVLQFRAWVWAAAALSITTLSELLARSGLVPDILTFADFALVYLGLVAVLVRGVRNWTVAAQRLLIALVGLFVLACLSAVLHGTEPLRPLAAFAVWAEPFVLVLLFFLEPPSQRERRYLLLCFGALVVLQLPIAVLQAATLGIGDLVKGTLTHAHLMAGFTVLGGLALLSWGYNRSLAIRLYSAVGALLFVVLVPVLTDAKQVTFALPAAALVFLAATKNIGPKVMTAAIVAGSLAVLLLAVPAGKVAADFLSGTATSNQGKVIGLETAFAKMRTEWPYVAFGLGPANGLSRIAYLTSDSHAQRGSAPLARLHLAAAPLPLEAAARAKFNSIDNTSVSSPLSSALGIFTDLGLIGLLAFLWVVGATVAPLIRLRREWLARAALAGWLLSAPLALVFDWWEQPPFMVPLAILTGLAAATATSEEAAQ
jgi:hypothetical protein